MRKSFIVLFISCLVASVMSVNADSWDELADVEKSWDGQKTVTNQDYEKVINALQEKKDKVEEKKKKKRFRKIIGGGTSLHKELNPENDIKEMPVLKTNKDGLLINSPVELLLDNVVLERGFYNVYAERDEQKKIHIKFYQSQYFKGEVIAEETKDDFEEDVLDFAKILPYNESFVKLIFGSVDFNAFVYIPYQE